MKHYCYPVALLCLFCCIQAQSGHAQNLDSPCGADYWRAKSLQDPTFFQKNEEYEQDILQVFEQQKNNPGLRAQVKVLPTVVHIIHDGGAENISDAQVQQAIAWLNQTLANGGAFDQGSGANSGIQLCLAQRTPNGQPSNGITRDQSPLTEMQLETQDQQLKNLNRWKTTDFVNIWLVRSICSSNYGCGVYGYSNYPFAHGSNIDGIVIEAAYVAQIEKITGLAHEMGHYLGLYHSFEGGCDNNNCMVDGDRICDTPPDQSTAGVPCTETVNTCSTDVQSGPFTADQQDMSWNFMDYGIIACFHDFTPDQATRMNATLDGVRHSLLDSKGCLPPCPAPTLAAFTSSDTAIGVGQTVTFSNTSQNANTFTWTVNGTPFGNQPNANYTFNAPGTYTVVLTALPANTTLCDISTASVVIQVVCDVTASFTVSQLYPEENETIFLTNNSQNATQTEWFLNGVSQGASLDSLSFSMAGSYEITLITQKGPCEATTTMEVYVQGICDEDHRLFQFLYKTMPNDFNFGRAVVILEDGNLLFLFENIERKVGLVKMTPAGQQLWAKIVGDSLVDYTYTGGLAATSDSGFVCAFRASQMPSQSSIAKFSSAGNLLWSYQFIGNVNLYDLVATPDGKITVCGTEGEQFEHRPFFAQLDADGVAQWVKIYNELYLSSGSTIAALPDGTFVSANPSGLMIRLSSTGSIIWSKTFPDFQIHDVIATQTMDIVACGTDNIYLKGVIVKIPADGVSSMFLRYTISGPAINSLTKIIEDEQKGYVLLAHQYDPTDEASIFNLDSTGQISWARKYPGSPQSFLSDIHSFKDIGYVLIGMLTMPAPSGWVLKTDRKGRTATCPSEPTPVSVASGIGFSTTLDSFPELPPLSLGPSNLLVQDWSIIPDTLCSFGCASLIEICNNNLDDDGDGLFDCLDPDCHCIEDQCATKNANIWYFGDKAGLDFNTDPPTVLTDGKTHDTAVSTITDINGKMLLYTDGFEVFNRFNEPMPNGFNKGNWLIPNPVDKSLYYLLKRAEVGFGVSYHTIDMTLDNGKGDVRPGNPTPLILPSWGDVYNPDLTKSCAPNGYWLTTRTIYTNTFLSFHIDGNGINPNPVISHIGADTSFWGRAKFSPDGRLFAVETGYPQIGVEVFNFDATSGMLSNSRFLPILYDIFEIPGGLEFSPSGRFLYISTFPLAGSTKAPLLQLDLENPTPYPFVIKEMGPPIHDLKLAPNGKIYGALGGYQAYVALDVIHNPDGKNAACQYEANGLPIATINGAASFPFTPPINHFLPSIWILGASQDTLCSFENVAYKYQIERPICGIDSLEWLLEGIQGQLSAQGDSATVQFFSPGSGRLIVTAHTPCGISSDTLDILVAIPINKTIDLGPDIVVCQNGVFSFNAGSGFARYQWSDGTADSTITTLFPGKYWVNAWDLCGNMQTDTITVTIALNSVLDLGPDLPQQCSGISTSFQLPANFASWQWSPSDFLSCADCPSVTVSPTSSGSWVVYAQTADGCISVDSLNATIRDTLLFSRDTFVCEGQMIALYGTHLPADTTAQFLLPAPGLGCDTLLTVNIFGVENAASELSVTICANAVFDFHGALLPADTVAVFHLSSALACDSVVTVRVNSFPPLTLTLPMDTTIRIGASVLLEAETNGTGTLDFMWSPSEGLSCITCPDPIANPLDTITYTLAVTDGNGCTAQESVTIRVNEECRVRVPNAFTPNGDGSNDRFRPIMDPCVKTVLLWKLVNRWGQTVFEQINFSATDSMLGWDGIWDGKPHPSDVLVWVAEFEFYDGRREVKNGELSLIR